MLELENIAYHYKNMEHDTLKGINAKFDNGKFISIIGPSGSGKSTLLAIMSGMDKATGGSVFVDGKNLDELNGDTYRKAYISMIFQAFHLLPNLTVIENVAYVMQISGKKREQAIKIAHDSLLKVGITQEHHFKFPSNLSGGQQQRVAIARAISTDAKTILADEPTGNLDYENTENIVMLLKKLAHEYGYCVIVVTHSMEIANQSDLVYKMNQGILEIQ